MWVIMRIFIHIVPAIGTFSLVRRSRILAAGESVERRRRWPYTTRQRAGARRAPDLVRRHFSANEPNILWVADATYSTPSQRSPPVLVFRPRNNFT